MAQYIAQQEEHHRKRSFEQEVHKLVERYGLEWHKEDETVENGFIEPSVADAPRFNGVLMRPRIDEPRTLLIGIGWKTGKAKNPALHRGSFLGLFLPP